MSSPSFSFGSYSGLNSSPSLGYSPSFEVSPVRGVSSRRFTDGRSGGEASSPPVGLWQSLDNSGQSDGGALRPDDGSELKTPGRMDGTANDNVASWDVAKDPLSKSIRSTSPPPLKLGMSPSPPVGHSQSSTLSPEALLAKELVSAQASLHELQSQTAQELVSPEKSQYLQLQQSPNGKHVAGLGEQVFRLQGEVSLLKREVVLEIDLPGAVTKITESIVKDHTERLRQELHAVEQTTAEDERKVERVLRHEIENFTKHSREEMEKTAARESGKEWGKLQTTLNERIGTACSEFSASIESASNGLRQEMKDGFVEAKKGLAHLGDDVHQRTDAFEGHLKGLEHRLEKKLQELEAQKVAASKHLEAEFEKFRRRCEELENRQSKLHDEDASAVQGLERRLEAIIQDEVKKVQAATAAEISKCQGLNEEAIADACRSMEEHMKEGLRGVSQDLAHRCSALEKTQATQSEKQHALLSNVDKAGEAGVAEAKRLFEHLEKSLSKEVESCRSEAREQCGKVRQGSSQEITRLERQIQEVQGQEQQVLQEAVAHAVQAEAQERAKLQESLQAEIRRMESATRTQVEALARDDKEKRHHMEDQMKHLEASERKVANEMQKLISATESNLLKKIAESREAVDACLQKVSDNIREEKRAAENHGDELLEKLDEIRAIASRADRTANSLEKEFEDRIKGLHDWAEKAMETANERAQVKLDDALVRLTQRLETKVDDAFDKETAQQEKRTSELEGALRTVEESMKARFTKLDAKEAESETKLEKIDKAKDILANQLSETVKKFDAKLKEAKEHSSKEQERAVLDAKRLSDSTMTELRNGIGREHQEVKDSLRELQATMEHRFEKVEAGAVDLAQKCIDRAKETKETMKKATESQKFAVEQCIQKLTAEAMELRQEVKQSQGGVVTGIPEASTEPGCSAGEFQELGRAVREVHRGFRDHGQRLHEEVLAREASLHSMEEAILTQVAESLNQEKAERDTQLKQFSEALRKMATSDKRQIGACESMVRKRAHEVIQRQEDLEVHFRTELGRLESRSLDMADSQARLAERLEEFHSQFDGHWQQNQRTLQLFEDSISATKAQFDNVEADIKERVEGIFRRELAKKVMRTCEERHRLHLDELWEKFDGLQKTLENPGRTVGSAWVPESENLVRGIPTHGDSPDGPPYGTRGDHPRGRQFQNVMRQALSVQRSFRRCEGCPDPI